MKNKNVTKLETRNSTPPLSMWVYILLVGILFIILSTQSASAQLTGYKYKDLVKVHENSGSQKINYQVMLNINTAALVTAGKMQANGSDIRFTKDCMGATLLNYYIETGMNTPNTIIWVEADTLKASADYIMYMWYGNATATPASSFTNTFPITTVFIDSTATPQVLTGTKAYSWFEIRSGSTVTVGPDSILKINARKIKIDGIINANGAGFAGGAPSSNGSGPGGGFADLSTGVGGGGGGSYGGSGGTGSDPTGTPSNQLGQPGALYGTNSSDSIDMGSGGAGAAVNGGAGGGGISLWGDVVEVSGTINANGSNGILTGAFGGGGGGSGGGVRIKGNMVNFSGNITAAGGNGGSGGYGGAGGGGGRIKIFSDASISNSGSENVSGGTLGSSNPANIPSTNGDSGVFFVGTYVSKVPTYTITPNPSLVVDAGATQVICNGGATTIGGSPTGSGGTGTLSYAWLPSSSLNNSAIANPTATPTTTTQYSVTVTDANGCQVSDTATVAVQVCTGVQQLSSDDGLRLYPTVCNSYFTIEANFVSGQNVDIKLTNMLGQKVISIEHSTFTGAYKKEVNISALPEGIYFLVLQTDIGIVAKKIIKN